jgi:NhaP-type Na+/H+ and K+/H+ antiporter
MNLTTILVSLTAAVAIFAAAVHFLFRDMDIKTILVGIAVIGSTFAAVVKFLFREAEDVRKVIDEFKNPRRGR